MRRSGLTLALACGLAWLYGGVARGLITQWAVSPDAAYGAILAAVAVVLFWRARRRAGADPSPSFASVSGAAVTAVGLILYLAGLFSADLFLTRTSFVLVLGGLIWFLDGSAAARRALTPLLFFLLSLPLPEIVVTALTASLQSVASHLAEVTIVAAGVPVFRDGNILELPSTTLQVVEACSGLRSVVSLGSVGVLLAWASTAGAWRRVILLASTVPIAVLINGLRIAATGIAAETWGPALTRDPWHSIFGWLTFVASLAALGIVGRTLGRESAAAVAYPDARVVHS